MLISWPHHPETCLDIDIYHLRTRKILSTMPNKERCNFNILSRHGEESEIFVYVKLAVLDFAVVKTHL